MIMLKRSNTTLAYRPSEMITEYALLRDYNVRRINKTIENQQAEIQALYDLNMSHVISDDNGNLCSVSTSVENLIIMLDEQRQRLASFKRFANKNLKLLNSIMEQYSPRNRAIIKHYFKRGVPQPYNPVIKQLRIDIFKIENARHLRRLATQEILFEMEMKDHVNELKEKMALSK